MQKPSKTLHAIKFSLQNSSETLGCAPCVPSDARLRGPAMPSLSPEQAQKRLRSALEENGCHLTDDELRTAMARVGAPEQYDEAMMVLLVKEGLHCWARKDQTAAVTTALGMNQLGLEKDFEELKDKFNEMLGVLDEVMQISGISQDSNPRKKVEEMRGSLEKKVTEVKQTVESKAKHDKHDEWDGLTYEQAFQDREPSLHIREPSPHVNTYQLGSRIVLQYFFRFFVELENLEMPIDSKCTNKVIFNHFCAACKTW